MNTGNPLFQSGYKEQNPKLPMQERIGFKTDETRLMFFAEIRSSTKSKTWKELWKKLGLPRTTFQHYQYEGRLMPKDLFQRMLYVLPTERQDFFTEETFSKPPNWGAIKGGSIGIKKIRQKYDKETIRKWCQKAGRNSSKSLQLLMKQNPEERYMLLRRKKLRKSMRKIEKQTKLNEEFFKKREIKFDLGDIELSNEDIKRGIRIPNKLCPKLAEEIGIHLGDGTLSTKKYYFSVRGDLKEEKYYADFILPLYKELYNINPPLLKRSLACGFEISSKGMREFKNKVLELTVGTKTYKAKVPACIMESRNIEIMQAFLRGLFDTDGCYYFHSKKKYPVISLCIKSRELINKVSEILILLGFSPQLYEKGYTIYINGVPKFKKWIEEIGSNNPKHQKRIEKIKQTLPWSSLDRLFSEKSPSKDASLRSS